MNCYQYINLHISDIEAVGTNGTIEISIALFTKFYFVTRTPYVKGDYRILKINRLILDYVYLNKYTLKMKHTHLFFYFY